MGKIKIKHFMGLIYTGCIECHATPSLRLTSVNEMTSLNITVLSSQYGGRLQSKWMHYQKPFSEMKGMQEKESIMMWGVDRKIRPEGSLSGITRQKPVPRDHCMPSRGKNPSRGITVWHHKAKIRPEGSLFAITRQKSVPEGSLSGKNPSRGITVCHHEAKIRPEGSLSGITRQASWRQTVIPRDGFFYLPLTPMIDSYNLDTPLSSSSDNIHQMNNV